ncbi:MAG: glycoside hydrolase family 31 protein [Prolixibacteraceae bacterium]
MKYFKNLAVVALLIFIGIINSQAKEITIQLSDNEAIWAGVIDDGHLMPFETGYSMNFYANNKGNQINPLILTNRGQYIWSEKPYSFKVDDGKIIINDPYSEVVTGKSGNTLAEAYRFVADNYFPASGKMPDELMFAAPQYNTWIELNYNHNQADILKYAQAIIDNGLPAGVFMIDDTWQEDYGLWDFHPGRFPDPKAMVDQLHEMGFKVMLWVCPFVSADQKLIYYELLGDKAFMMSKNTSETTWETAKHPAMIPWWNGISAELDFSNPAAVNWFNAQLERLVNDYNVDGFKLDAADMHFYPENSLSKGNATPNEQCELYTQFGMRFPLNEYRACWKMAGQPLAQRLLDKDHSWEDLERLIPLMIVEGLSGYTFACPDMIGGGMLSTFEDPEKLNQELIVRSAQCSALMPMMQFSVAPWRILDETHMNAIRESVNIRMKFTPLILRLAKESAKIGEPILKSMEYVFPDQGFEKQVDQFMVGDSLLVAPKVDAPGSTRTVYLPKGKWMSDTGEKYKGGKSYEIEVPLERLPYFQKL